MRYEREKRKREFSSGSGMFWVLDGRERVRARRERGIATGTRMRTYRSVWFSFPLRRKDLPALWTLRVTRTSLWYEPVLSSPVRSSRTCKSTCLCWCNPAGGSMRDLLCKLYLNGLITCVGRILSLKCLRIRICPMQAKRSWDIRGLDLKRLT